MVASMHCIITCTTGHDVEVVEMEKGRPEKDTGGDLQRSESCSVVGTPGAPLRFLSSSTRYRLPSTSSFLPDARLTLLS